MRAKTPAAGAGVNGVADERYPPAASEIMLPVRARQIQPLRRGFSLRLRFFAGPVHSSCAYTGGCAATVYPDQGRSNPPAPSARRAFSAADTAARWRSADLKPQPEEDCPLWFVNKAALLRQIAANNGDGFLHPLVIEGLDHRL